MDKLTRSEVVLKAYDLASDILTARANDGTIMEMLTTDDGLSEHDAARVENEVRKIGERLLAHTRNLKG
jgi:hypothetical protein